MRKTFARRYRDNLARILAFTLFPDDAADSAGVAASVEEAFRQIRERHGLRPALDDANGYRGLEYELLSARWDGVLVARCQGFAMKRAAEETDRATFQAMEALIHNLNTMHSRAGA